MSEVKSSKRNECSHPRLWANITTIGTLAAASVGIYLLPDVFRVEQDPQRLSEFAPACAAEYPESGTRIVPQLPEPCQPIADHIPYYKANGSYSKTQTNTPNGYVSQTILLPARDQFPSPQSIVNSVETANAEYKRMRTRGALVFPAAIGIPLLIGRNLQRFPKKTASK